MILEPNAVFAASIYVSRGYKARLEYFSHSDQNVNQKQLGYNGVWHKAYDAGQFKEENGEIIAYGPTVVSRIDHPEEKMLGNITVMKHSPEIKKYLRICRGVGKEAPEPDKAMCMDISPPESGKIKHVELFRFVDVNKWQDATLSLSIPKGMKVTGVIREHSKKTMFFGPYYGPDLIPAACTSNRWDNIIVENAENGLTSSDMVKICQETKLTGYCEHIKAPNLYAGTDQNPIRRVFNVRFARNDQPRKHPTKPTEDGDSDTDGTAHARKIDIELRNSAAASDANKVIDFEGEFSGFNQEICYWRRARKLKSMKIPKEYTVTIKSGSKDDANAVQFGPYNGPSTIKRLDANDDSDERTKMYSIEIKKIVATGSSTRGAWRREL